MAVANLWDACCHRHEEPSLLVREPNTPASISAHTEAMLTLSASFWLLFGHSQSKSFAITITGFEDKHFQITCFMVKSLMRWWLCSLRLQCKETQSL